MKSILKQLFLLSFFTSLGFGQFLYVWNQRTHSELTWQTIETKHFQIHYHNGLDSVAIKASKIAETAYQPILDQLNLDDFGPTHITLTAEDEIMNGFAMPSNQIFIWVSQNDVAGHFGGSEKWLKMVLTHEFQHVAQFQAQKTLLGPFGQIGTPSWWIEGMAEYNTEVWRVGRADVNLKSFTYRSNIEKLEAHSDGYAKVLYLAWKYGDSTLVKISNEKVYFDKKTKKWPLSFTFEKAFKTHTGQSVREFEKEWKRVMQAYYFSVMAQKESVEEVGKTLGFRGYRSISSLSLAPDSSHWAIVGQRSKGIEIDEVWIQSTDSVKSNVLLHRGEFSSKNSWSPDSKSVLVSERHRGQYGSLIYDIRLIGLDKKIRWVSENLRGHYPIFSQDKTRFYCVGHPEGETSQIYEIDISTSKTTQITAFSGDVQLRDLCLSPDGKNIAFMIQDEDGFPDIMTFNISDKFVEKITHDRFEDLSPVWNHRGDEIIFTSYRNEIPNLFMASLSDSSDTLYQITDVAEGLWSHQYLPDYTILSTSISDQDTVRFIRVDSKNRVQQSSLILRNKFNEWRYGQPEISIPEIDFSIASPVEKSHPYMPFKNMISQTKFILPDVDGVNAFGVFNDPIGKHLLTAGGLVSYSGKISEAWFTYSNFSYKPVLTLYGIKNVFGQATGKSIDDYDVRNGAGMLANFDFNAGDALYTNHSFISELHVFDHHNVSLKKPDLSTEPDFHETSYSIQYGWLTRLPYKNAIMFPKHGTGLKVKWEQALDVFENDVSYTSFNVDVFSVGKIPKTPIYLYGRVRSTLQSNTIPELIQGGLYGQSFANASQGTIWNSVMRPFGENPIHFIRGLDENQPGNQTISGTVEARLPLFNSIPAEIFGLSMKQFSASIFADYGQVDGGDWQNGAGLELRFSLDLGGMPLAMLGFGIADDYQSYIDFPSPSNDVWRERAYFNFTVMSPF